MSSKNKAPIAPDLFSMLDPDPRWDLPPMPPDLPPDEKILTIGRNQYLIRIKHPHPEADPKSDDPKKQETHSVWQIFIRGTAAWQRLRLIGTNPETVPNELIQAAEAMLEWTAERDWESQRTRAAQLRPPPADEDDPVEEISLLS
jgi:hypothetical protein